MYYVNKGLVLYVECDPTSEKVSTIMHNNSVAVNVDENYEDWKKIKGVQLFGVIEEVKESKWDSINSMFLEKFPQLEEYGGTPRHHKFYEISPSKVYFLDFEGYFGKRELLRIEPKKSILRWS